MARQVTALDDPKRLGVLRSYEIFDTQPEPVFDRLAQLAAHICGTPYAAISVVDGTGPSTRPPTGPRMMVYTVSSGSAAKRRAAPSPLRAATRL